MIERRRASEPGATPPAAAGAMEPEVRALVERAALAPGGLALLEGAALECAAVLLGVSPRLLERARAALRDPVARGAALEVAARAAARRPRAPERPEAPPRPAGRRGPDDVIRAARERPGGGELLLSAAPESAAVAFGVHPEVILAARELARCGAGALPSQP